MTYRILTRPRLGARKLTQSRHRLQTLISRVRPLQIKINLNNKKHRSFRVEIRSDDKTRTVELVRRKAAKLPILPKTRQMSVRRRARLQIRTSAVAVAAEAVADPRQQPLRLMEETLAMPLRRKKRQEQMRIRVTSAAKGAIAETEVLTITPTKTKDKMVDHHRLRTMESRPR